MIEQLVILESDEIPNCSHEWKDEVMLSPVNPNGEYVRGYGYIPVFISEVIGKRCIQCGYIEYANEL